MLVRTQDGSVMLETFTFTYNDNIFKTAQKNRNEKISLLKLGKFHKTSSHLYAYTAVSQPSSSEQDPLHKSGKSTQEAYIKRFKLT